MSPAAFSFRNTAHDRDQYDDEDDSQSGINHSLSHRRIFRSCDDGCSNGYGSDLTQLHPQRANGSDFSGLLGSQLNAGISSCWTHDSETYSDDKCTQHQPPQGSELKWWFEG